MIYRFRKVCPNLYRGSAPRNKDIKELKSKYNIKNIVSLDEDNGERISDLCKKYNINQVKAYVNFNKEGIDKLKKLNLDKIIKSGPTFVHCRAGKDRTGFLCGLYEINNLNKSCSSVIRSAKALGYGSFCKPEDVSYGIKLICNSCSKKHKHYNHDNNSADIVSNVRQYKGDNHDSYLDTGHQGSFAPMLGTTRQYPYDNVYNSLDEQGGNKRIYNVEESRVEDGLPQVGVYDNAAGIAGAGPTENYGGFLHD